MRSSFTRIPPWTKGASRKVSQSVARFTVSTSRPSAPIMPPVPVRKTIFSGRSARASACATSSALTLRRRASASRWAGPTSGTTPLASSAAKASVSTEATRPTRP